MKKTALIVVDLQEDFVAADGALSVGQGRSIVPGINSLLNLQKYPWAAVIGTQDWHPPDHTSFASQHGVEPFSQLDFQHPLDHKDDAGKIIVKTQTVWPDHCIQDTLGSSLDASFLAQFNVLDGKVPKAIVKKGYLKDREYYSCFKDTWKLHKTEMEEILLKLEITDAVFVGLAYDFCVLNSAADCLEMGINTYVVKGLSKSVYPDNIEDTDRAYTEAGVKILESIEEFSFQ